MHKKIIKTLVNLPYTYGSDGAILNLSNEERSHTDDKRGKNFTGT